MQDDEPFTAFQVPATHAWQIDPSGPE